MAGNDRKLHQGCHIAQAFVSAFLLCLEQQLLCSCNISISQSTTSLEFAPDVVALATEKVSQRWRW